MIYKTAFRRGIIAIGLMLAASIATLAAAETESTETKTGEPPITSAEPNEEQAAGTLAPGQAQPKKPPLTEIDPTKVPHPGVSPAHKTPANLAEAATDPSAVLMQMQFQYHGITTEGEETLARKVIFQPILPLSKKNVMRATLPVLSQPVGGELVRGLGDLTFLDFFLMNVGKSTIGPGPAAIFPTATDDALGTGKLSIGADFLWMYKGIKKTQWGMLMEYFHSVAGDSDRADVNLFNWQPIYTHHFKSWYASWTSQWMTYNFEADSYTIPVGAVFGKVFMAKRTPWNISVEPYYVMNDVGPNEWALKFQFTVIIPKFKW
jgi:hypothetical protein